MNRLPAYAVLPLMCAAICTAQTNTSTDTAASAETQPPATAPAAHPGSISVQEMLVSGPTQLKLHSLAMITQGNIKGEVDASYLPGLKVCAEDPALPLRSVAAQILGQHFIQNTNTPNPEAVAILSRLAQDDSSYVRYNAVYHGLSQIKNKSDDIIELLIDVAANDREQGLYDRIADSLKADQDRVTAILDKKLQDGNNVAMFEMYQDLTGKEPGQADKYLDMPCSRPKLFIFKITGDDAEAYKAGLQKALEDAGIKNPNLEISGEGESAVALLRTYITKDRLAVEKGFENLPDFPLTQSLWLTPEMDIQLQKMKKQ